MTEFTSNIYYKQNYLHHLIKEAEPTVLIDIGANIGLSTLSFLTEFPSIKKVIAIEAEEKNFSVLDANFTFWKSQRPEVDWIAINGVATHSEEAKLVRTLGLMTLREAILFLVHLDILK